MLKLLILSCLVVFLVTRLIALLGKTGSAQFVSNSLGKVKLLKDVTNTINPSTIVDHALIEPENKEDVLSGVADIIDKVDKFSLSSFVKSAREAMKTISLALERQDDALLKELVEPGFVQECKSLSSKIMSMSRECFDRALVMHAYMFSNKAFITLSVDSPACKWTFSKHVKQNNPKWNLSSITMPDA